MFVFINGKAQPFSPEFDPDGGEVTAEFLEAWRAGHTVETLFGRPYLDTGTTLQPVELPALEDITGDPRTPPTQQTVEVSLGPDGQPCCATSGCVGEASCQRFYERSGATICRMAAQCS